MAYILSKIALGCLLPPLAILFYASYPTLSSIEYNIKKENVMTSLHYYIKEIFFMSLLTTPVESTLNALKEAQNKLQLPNRAIQKLLLSFLQSSQPLIEELFEAAQTNNITKLKEKAHALKGIAASLQFTTIAENCHTLESEAGDDTVAIAKRVYEEVTAIATYQESILKQL
jgi:HPt (histidine-containing phosphotransfer) domain-containing protein